MNSVRRILFASVVGSTIEFFDFYTYANAAVLVFPKLFFPASEPIAAMMGSLATFAIAFFARPLGSAVFGHFGDRVGRKATLVASLLTMGASTVLIGLLPGYAVLGPLAPALLALCRFGQGLGLGGEWGGAVLLATENAPPGRQAWFGMFPQLGAPLGFLLSGGAFLALTRGLSDAQFADFGWRIPFLASAVLVVVGLYVRLNIAETPAFARAMAHEARVKLPMAHLLRHHLRVLVLGTFMALATFVLFYLMTVFSMGWATTALHVARTDFLWLQLLSVLFFGLTIPLSAAWADRWDARRVLMAISAAIAGFGFTTASLFGSGTLMGMGVYLCLGMALMGLTYGPLSAMLAQLFPTPVRYTGASVSFNMAGILGASLAPYAATWLAQHHGLGAVGLYLSVAAALTWLALYAAAGDMNAGADTPPASR